MKALVLREYMKLEYAEVSDPVSREGEVLVQVKACGICGSDVHGMDGSTGRRRPPIVMGHEASGVIAAAGSGVTGWKAGDRVTFDSTIFCGECWYCRRGLINLCDNRRVLGVSCDEYRQDGAFAQFVSLPQRILYRLPSEVSFEHATMVESLSIALHAVRRCSPTLGDTVVVVGAGVIGTLVMQALRLSGCGTIVAVDVDQSRLDFAASMGADKTVLGGADEAREIVRSVTEGRGADKSFEVVGSTPALATAMACLRKGGSLVMVGNYSPAVELALQAAVAREISLHGSCASCWEYPACLELIAARKIDVGKLLSATAPLSDGALWFERLYRREKGLMKVVLAP